MKRTVAIILIIAMALSISACGSTINTDTSDISVSENTSDADTAKMVSWALRQSVDEFGDVTADSKAQITSRFSGTFSNTATNESNLSGEIFFQQKDNSEHYIAGFTLFEYEDKQATFFDSDEKVLKVKIDDNIYTFPLQGVSPNGDLFVGVDAYDYSGDWLMLALSLGIDLRCIINLGSSQYSFSLNSDNIADLMTEENIPAPPAQMTARDALTAFLLEDIEGIVDAKNFFYDHINDYEIVTSEELENLLSGNNFFEVEIETAYNNNLNYNSWVMMKYNHHERTQLSYVYRRPDTGASRIFEASNYKPTGFSISNDKLFIGDNTYEIRKITDDIYVRYNLDSSRKTVDDYIMIRYNEPVQSVSDVATMLATIIVLMLP